MKTSISFNACLLAVGYLPMHARVVAGEASDLTT